MSSSQFSRRPLGLLFRATTHPATLASGAMIVSVVLATLADAWALIFVLLFWFSLPILVGGAISAFIEPKRRLPRTILWLELKRLWQLLRAGIALFVVAMVSAATALAVQIDFTPDTAGPSQIGELFVIVMAGALIVGLLAAIVGHIVRLSFEGKRARRKGFRRAVVLVARYGNPQVDLRFLRAPYLRRWEQFLADDTVVLLGGGLACIGIVVDTYLLLQAVVPAV